jgi:hypothetical protein
LSLQRGFRNDPRRSAGDADLPSAAEDLIRVIDTLIEIDEGDRDENGFSVNWDGALARIKKEFDFSFSYGPPSPCPPPPSPLSHLTPSEGESYTVDAVELKVKLEDVAQMLTSYGEYLSPDHRDGYIELFLEHILRGAKGPSVDALPSPSPPHSSEQTRLWFP